MSKLVVMNKTIWLAFGMTVLVTFASCLLPRQSLNRIPIRVENDNATPGNSSATPGYVGFDTFYVLHNYCMVKFSVVNPSK
jgi:hypothetical protein